MKQKILGLLLIAILCVSVVFCDKIDTKAEDLGENIEYSELLTEVALIGAMQNQTWGVYLAEGNSIINKISSTKIGAGGNTIAAVKCKVSITSIVERLVNGSWVRVTSWTSTTTSGYSASISKSLTVSTGYYYRVRSSHYASSDVSSSWTDALWM